MNEPSGIFMEPDFKRRKKEIYIPLKKLVKEVIAGLTKLELNIPIAQIARMDLAGNFKDETLQDLQTTIHDYLKVTNQYRKLYFEFMKETKTIFDAEMNKDGSFAPGLKQYNSIKNQLYEAILRTDGKAWIMSYDQYLPTIREHASKIKKQPRTGVRMFKDLKKHFGVDLKNIKDSKKLSIQVSKLFLKDLRYAIKNPELSWQEWLTNEELANPNEKNKKISE
jgi:hypothetical protein